MWSRVHRLWYISVCNLYTPPFSIRMHSTKTSSTCPSPTGFSSNNSGQFKVKCSLSNMIVRIEGRVLWDQKLNELSKEESPLSVYEARDCLVKDFEILRECTDTKAQVVARYKRETLALVKRMQQRSMQKERNSKRHSSTPVGESI